ncbi:pyridoxamine 5-phosphate oxidase-related FMN-binding protein [Desulfovibrio sp. X2]|uniref:pyridoxamine 5'-phosphate oxidase family protein n=1 Tax=Desulfovibrio sp. X2 TaxID=941449 RepID=UPI000358D3BB|nr:pyridoxamine 5'-phosphate oxidase family protein [Desulfovibrio sp. X2]EPR44310.1 pyridoxamine 5-phosphate oxidase-related FMN-binding protein [Desulfovibrio sp. X2]
MIPEKMLEVIKNEGVAAIATQGEDGPHMVNTWNSYLKIVDGRIVVPVGGMNKTERNLAGDDRVLMTVGSRKVAGRNGPGTGFLIRGTAAFETAGPHFDAVAGFKWARAALVITVASAEQTL